jgi:hypothetical protein
MGATGMIASHAIADHLPTIEEETSQPESLIPVSRPFAARSAGFAAETLFGMAKKTKLADEGPTRWRTLYPRPIDLLTSDL